MPDIAEMKKIFDNTPIEQAILIESIHGQGKSEIVKEVFEAQGYTVVTLFLGQMADAGDLIGLPDRTEIEIRYGGKTVTQKFTEFCPPKWWNFDDDAKLVIFLDEFNRGKPEVYQCVMDLVLNRKLQGLKLPKHTRIIAAQNPELLCGEQSDYDVVELEPALMDRFNIYEFKPTANEWIDWAVKEKVHNVVIGFIVKNNQFLDPPPDKKRKNEVYPSRRSWKRVSDILVAHPELLNEENQNIFKTILFGIVGAGAVSKLITYIRESVRNISGAKIVTGWDADVERQIKELNNQDLVHLNKEIALYLEQENSVLFESGKKAAEQYAYNVEKYCKTVPKEIMAEFFDQITDAEQKGKKWGDNLLSCNQRLVNNFVDVLNGETKEEKEARKKLLEQTNIDPTDHFNDVKGF